MENINDLYYEKYMKYKLKYLKLKKGGGIFDKRKDIVTDKFFSFLDKKFGIHEKKNVLIRKMNRFKYYTEDKEGKKVKKDLLDNQIAANKDLTGLRIYENYSNKGTFESYDLSNSHFGLFDQSWRENKFINATFKNVNWSNSELNRVKFKDTTFVNTNFSNIKYMKPDIDNCEFRDSNLAGVTFQTYEIPGISYISDMEKHTVSDQVAKSDQKIINTTFNNVNFTGASFIGGPIKRCYFNDNTIEQATFLSFIHNSNFKNVTFRWCKFGLEKQDFTSREIGSSGISIMILNCDFTNSELKGVIFTRVILKNCDFTNVSVNNSRDILLRYSTFNNCVNIFNLLENSMKKLGDLKSNQSNDIESCNFSNNTFTDNHLYFFYTIKYCNFDNCDFTQVTIDYEGFQNCKFNNCSFNFDSKLYKNLNKNINDEFNRTKNEIVNAKNSTNQWSELKDPNTGKTYYWNKTTNKTQWEKPN